MKPTFEDAYRLRYGCNAYEFRRTLFWGCLYPQGRVLAWFVGGYASRYFAPERDLISSVGQARSLKRVREEVRFYFMDPATWGLRRRTLRLRISTTQLQRRASELIPEAEVEFGVVSNPPQPTLPDLRATI